MDKVLVGQLANHPRGRILYNTLGIEGGELPTVGIAIAFGKDFQTDFASYDECLKWISQPGRLLLLIPPFNLVDCSVPCRWQTLPVEVSIIGESQMAQKLSSELRYHFTGELLPLERVKGQLITGGWRSHPNAGLLAITALPLWSPTLLNQSAIAQSWLTDLYEQAGEPLEPIINNKETVVSNIPPLESQDWTILVHCAGGDYSDLSSALEALNTSLFFRIEPKLAKERFQYLTEAGWLTGGRITPLGLKLLQQTPYAAYVTELRKVKHEFAA